jgi:hypothetical protein
LLKKIKIKKKINKKIFIQNNNLLFKKIIFLKIKNNTNCKKNISQFSGLKKKIKKKIYLNR